MAAVLSVSDNGSEKLLVCQAWRLSSQLRGQRLRTSGRRVTAAASAGCSGDGEEALSFGDLVAHILECLLRLIELLQACKQSSLSCKTALTHAVRYHCMVETGGTLIGKLTFLDPAKGNLSSPA